MDLDSRGLQGSLIVNDLESLRRLTWLLHDEHFLVDDIKHDPEAKRLTLPCTRCCHGQNRKKIEERLFWRAYEIPVLKCLLKFNYASSYSLVDTEQIGRYDFSWIEYNETHGLVKINTSVPLTLNVSVEKLEIEYYEIGYQGRAEMTHGLLGTFGPKFMED